MHTPTNTRVQAMFAQRSSLGLVGSSVDVHSGAWRDREATSGPGVDSYYEYLLKVRACPVLPACSPRMPALDSGVGPHIAMAPYNGSPQGVQQRL